MATLAPARTIALAAVVIHAHRRPDRRPGMAIVAVHGGPIQQLTFRDVIARLGQGTLNTRREETAVVAGLAGRSGNHGVIHRHRHRKRGLGLVAAIALGCAGRDRNVRCGLALGGGSVMAGITGPGTDRIGCRVSESRSARPAAGRLVTALAIAGDASVCRRGGLANGGREAARMACGALAADRDCAVYLGRGPGEIARLVAGVAIRDGNPCKSCVGDVGRRSTVSGRIGPGVAG